MRRILLSLLLVAGPASLARAEVLTTPGYSERDTPADLNPRRSRPDMLIDVQTGSASTQTSQRGTVAPSGQGGGMTGRTPYPRR